MDGVGGCGGPVGVVLPVVQKEGCAKPDFCVNGGAEETLVNESLVALKTAGILPAEREKSNALWSICRKSLEENLSGKGLRERACFALTFVDQIPRLRIRSYALSDIFEALKRAGDEAKALEVLKKNQTLVNQMTDKLDQFYANFIIAKMFAATGERRRCLAHICETVIKVSLLPEGWHRDYAYYSGARELVRMGEISRAEELAEKIVDLELREKVLSQVRKSEKENLAPSL